LNLRARCNNRLKQLRPSCSIVAMETRCAAPPLELTFDNLLSEHLAAERLYYSSTIFWKLDKIVSVLLIGFGVYLTNAAGFVWWSVVWFPLGVLEWFNLLSLRPLQIWFWFKHNPKFAETYRLGIDESGINFRTDTIDSRLAWDHYNSCLENDRLCLLIYGTRMYSVIPKRAFSSPAQLDAFRSLVNRKLGHRPHGEQVGADRNSRYE
jgi:hypothetical protein